MVFKFSCPHCGQHISATPEDCGTEGACPTCGNTFTVPEPDPGVPPPVPAPRRAPAPAPRQAGRPRRILVLLLSALLVAGVVAASILWPHRSPEAVAVRMFEAYSRLDLGTMRGLVTDESKPSIKEVEEEIERMKKNRPAEAEMLNAVKVEVTGTRHHGGIAEVSLRATRPDWKKPPITPQVYARRTWLGWKVDLVLQQQMQKDLMNAKQIGVAIRVFENEYARHPKDLHELVDSNPRRMKFIEPSALLSPLLRGSTEPGYEYFGGPGKKILSSEIILRSKVPAFDGTRAVVYGSGKAVRE